MLLYLNKSVMLGNYLQQTTSADVIFQMHFFLGALRVTVRVIFESEPLSCNFRGTQIKNDRGRYIFFED